MAVLAARTARADAILDRFKTTVIGFGESAVLPARAVEWIRPYLLARREGLSATATFATILAERILTWSRC